MDRLATMVNKGDTIIWNHMKGTSIGVVSQCYEEYWPNNRWHSDVDTGMVQKFIAEVKKPNGVIESVVFINTKAYCTPYKMRVLRTGRGK